MMVTETNNNPPTLISRQHFWNIAKVIFGLVLVGIVAAQTTLSDLIVVWKNLQFVWLIPSWIFFIAIIFVLALRSWELIDRKVSTSTIFLLTIIQTLVGNLLATSAGAVSFITILRIRYKVSVSQGLLSVLVSKLADLSILLAMLSIGSLLVWPNIVSLHSIVVLLLILLLVGVVLGSLVLVFRRSVVKIADRFGLLHFANRYDFVRSLRGMLIRIVEDETSGLWQRTPRVMIYSIANIGFTLCFSYCNFQLLGMPLHIGILIFYVSLTQLITWLPIGVLGSIGVFEVSSIYILNQFGYGTPQLIPIFLSSRLCFYLLNLSLLPLLVLERTSKFRGYEE